MEPGKEPESQAQNLPSEPIAPPNPATLEKMPAVSKDHPILATAVILAIVFAVGIIAYLAYQNNLLQSQLKQSPTPLASTTPDPTAGWKTFSNTSFYFKYPSNFRVDASQNGVSIQFDQTGGRPLRFMSVANAKQSGIETLLSSIFNLEIGKNYEHPNYANSYTRLADTEIAGFQARVFEDKTPWESAGPLRTIIIDKNGEYYVFTVEYSNVSPQDPNNPETQVDFVNTFDQILSTFKFVDSESTELSTAVNIPLVSTTGWKRVNLGKLSFMIPSDAKYEITSDSRGLVYVMTSQSTLSVIPSISISVTDYKGGSKREQFWGGSTDETICRPIYQDGLFGSISALQIAIDSGQCQGGGGGIVTVLGDKFIVISNLQRDPSNMSQIVRFPVRDTVISTLKLEK